MESNHWDGPMSHNNYVHVIVNVKISHLENNILSNTNIKYSLFSLFY